MITECTIDWTNHFMWPRWKRGQTRFLLRPHPTATEAFVAVVTTRAGKCFGLTYVAIPEARQTIENKISADWFHWRSGHDQSIGWQPWDETAARYVA